MLKDDADFNPDVDTDLSANHSNKLKKLRTGSATRKISSGKEPKTGGHHVDTDVEVSDSENEDAPAAERNEKKRGNILRRLKFALWCMKVYYTAPVNKFTFNLASFSHTG